MRNSPLMLQRACSLGSFLQPILGDDAGSMYGRHGVADLGQRGFGSLEFPV